MFDHNRRKIILDLLQENKKITTNELIKNLNVSGTTIRSDLDHLENKNLLKRVHGGAVIPDETSDIPSYINFHRRYSKNTDLKKEIAKKASKLITDNTSIMLDASSTSFHLIQYLSNKDRIKIITNGLYTAMESQKIEGLEVFLIGGRLRPKYGAIEGLLGADILKHFNADFIFTSAHGFTFEKGMNELNIYEAQIKKMMIEKSEKVVALIDSTKIGKNSTSYIASIEQIDYFITDSKISEETINKLKKNNLNIV